MKVMMMMAESMVMAREGVDRLHFNGHLLASFKTMAMATLATKLMRKGTKTTIEKMTTTTTTIIMIEKQRIEGSSPIRNQHWDE